MKLKKLIKLNNCLKCRQCCKFRKSDFAYVPIFNKNEVEKIAEHGGKKISWRNYQGRAGSFQPVLVKSKKQDGWYVCPFLDEVKYLCIIEKIKPFDCRIWPFVLMRGKNGGAIFMAYYSKKYCPGLENIKPKELKKFKEYLVKFCKKNYFKRFLVAVWDYDGDALRLFTVRKKYERRK